ncbi:1,4-alpha-glucan branching protein [Ilyomonas limi]|uniref:1,4-alpha-glucan branching protein n=1 Tax=Ilyomonas limi TaxID=2575867 RepID=A0A4U3KT86_9BACT|nr:alpha-amylase family glycosyl hydrolase [Ilyomonas limi]TKK65715.1 1,4-alpha-glucan branching protein [Ilyomonas limi]
MSLLFKTVDWAEDSNIYEVNTRQYTKEGTFNAFAQHLPRLKDMGVEILWFMPITPIGLEKRQGSLGSYYAVADYTAVNREFGTMDDFKALVQQAHAMGMKVIIDWVANHTSPDSAWAKQYPEWYKKDANGNFTEAHGWVDVIDLDYTNKDMRQAMIAALQHWVVTCDIDGFRCDMAHLVPLDFWKEARTQCDAIKPLYWLAESDEADYLQVFDASYAWEWMAVSTELVQHQMTPEKMMNVLVKYASQCTIHAQKLLFTTNHDENSWNGTEYEKYGITAKTFAVFAATWQGIPLIYSGQELPNHKRLLFFDKDEIAWTEQQPALHHFYKTLLYFRKRCPVFDCGAELIRLTTGAEDKVVAYICCNNDKLALLLFNFSNAGRIKFSIHHERLKGTFRNVFSELSFQFDSTVEFEMQPWQYFVYERTGE